MWLIDKIESLQKKPESIRRRILFVSMVVIMFVIVAVWIFSLSFSLKSKEKSETSFTPFKIFGGLVKDAYNVSLGGVKSAVDQIWKLKTK